MKLIQKLFKWATLLFFGVAIYAMTIGQTVPVEFADWNDQHLFYDLILRGLPIAVLLTLVWTIKKERPKKTNIAIGVATPLLAAGMLFLTFSLMFSYGFGAWVDEMIIYENKSNSEITIDKQIWDIGAFGYGGQRTVKLIPFLGLWNLVERIDTAKIEKNHWTLVEREGDIKLP